MSQEPKNEFELIEGATADQLIFAVKAMIAAGKVPVSTVNEAIILAEKLGMY